ncbi:hypothetical protein [Vibrio cholerae]|uniref:hypothetical protein n=1 Tax=Vibrio cholerae TaxID=666 RepID=UPI0021B27752|nr:hypothetical protein [Vibrio cholerae]
MSLSKLFRIFTGNVNKAAESVIDANAITILEQEQRESKEAVRKAEDSWGLKSNGTENNAKGVNCLFFLD